MLFRNPCPTLRTTLHNVILFLLCDAFFGGLAYALTFTSYGVPGVLKFVVVQQIATTLGHVLGYRLLKGYNVQSVFRFGLVNLAASILLAGIAPAGIFPLILLGVYGGISRGMVWGSRLWLEMHLPKKIDRHGYYQALEALSIVVKLLIPAISALALWQGEQIQSIFVWAGYGLLPLTILAWCTGKAVAVPAPRKLEPFALLRQKGYWDTAGFYILDGISHALRTVLFSSALLVSLKSVAGYSALEAASNLVAGVYLFWKVSRPRGQSSNAQFRLWVAVMLVAWGLLLCSIGAPWFVLPFVVLYSVALPNFISHKSAVVMQDMTGFKDSDRASNSLARSILLVSARVSSLGALLGVSQLLQSDKQLLTLMIVCAMGLLLVEYRFTLRLANMQQRQSV